jgi:RNA-directed DNA polymerase
VVFGGQHHAEALREEVTAALAPLGLRLAPEKTRVVHIDEGFDFLGFTIRRMRKRGTQKHYVYTKPSRKAIQAIKDKVTAKTYRSTRHMSLEEQITSLNRMLAGSLGVLELLHDVAFERFTERFCNTSATCGACCRRCSEPC